jgi:hypothetical protein
MDSFLTLLKFKQSNLAQNHFSHWVVVVEDDDDSTVYHIRKDSKSLVAKFEYFPFSSVENSSNIIEKIEVGKLNIPEKEFRKICRDAAKNYDFHIIKHNCQNWCKEVVEKANLDLPTLPTNESCGCLYLLKLCSDSEDLFSRQVIGSLY